jgi:hypothetical protein
LQRKRFVNLGHEAVILLKGIQQLAVHIPPVQGNAQGFGESLHRFDVLAQDEVALIASRLPGNIGGDGRVAIPIPAYPRAEVAKSCRRRLDAGKSLFQAAAEVLVQQGDGLKQHLFKIVQGVIDFVQNSRLGLMQLVGTPPKQDFFRHLFFYHLGLQRLGLFCPIQLAEQAREGPLLLANGVADDLGGVGGKNHANVQLLQQSAQ